jgi:aryl carrier-like protein
MPAEMFPDTLFGQLTTDIQARNESAFLGLASAAARPAITAWWDNLQAIGFTTGAVIPAVSIDAVHIDSQGDGSTVILAGAHNPLDPNDNNGKPDIPMARYRIGLHFAGPGAIGQITSWRPLDNAPWDLATPLYVRKAPYVVVAGPPGDRALVDQILPAAETAAAYEIKMMRYSDAAFLAQKGFVVFVSGSASVGDGWLATSPQPAGWPPEFLGARTVQLPGPGVTADIPVRNGTSSLVDNIADDTMGGARVVLGPAAEGTSHDETLTLVREFTLDILAAQDEELANGVPLKPVPAWPQEGLAVAVQFAFESDPNPTPARYSFTALTAALHALPSSYRNGTYPSNSQLFGPSVASDEAWGEVAASTYEYIHYRYNMSKMMISAMVLRFDQPTPFGNVFKSGTNASNLVFYGIHSIRIGWQPWLAGL